MLLIGRYLQSEHVTVFCCVNQKMNVRSLRLLGVGEWLWRQVLQVLQVCSPLTPMLKQKLSVWIQSDFSAFEGCGSKTCLRLCKPSPTGDPPPASRALIGGAAAGLFTACYCSQL